MHLSRKIIRILRRIATVPVLFLCHSLRTAHRIQKTCVLFFAVLPLFLFRVRIHPLTEDIPISLRRALADATPSLTALNLYPSASAFISKVRSQVSKYGLITRKEAPSISRMNLWKLLGVYRLPSASIAEARSVQISRYPV